MIEVKDLSLKFKDRLVFNHYNLTLKPGEFKVILGLNGAGKSQALKCILGLQKNYEGLIRIQSDPGVAFQDPLLFPWMSVRTNLEMISNELHHNWDEVVSSLNLHHLLDKTPSMLSGGESKRVALARAVLFNPRFLVLDEVFDNLDLPQRFELQDFLLKLWEKNQSTILLVTHDLDEAVYLAESLDVFVRSENRIVSNIKNPFPHPRFRVDKNLTPPNQDFHRYLYNCLLGQPHA